MADVQFEIRRDQFHAISEHTFRTALDQATGLLREYDSAISGRKNGVLVWNIGHLYSNGVLRVGFQSNLSQSRIRRGVSDVSGPVAKHLVSGFHAIDEELATPQYLSETGLKRIERMVGLIEDQRAASFSLKVGDDIAEVTRQTGDNLKKLLNIKRTSVGSIEGRLVGIDVRRNLQVNVVHHISGKSVKCVIPQDLMTQAKDALGNRVTVAGLLHKNERGETIRVDVGSIRERLSADHRVGLERLSAMPVPDFSQTANTEEYLQRTRGE